MRLTAVVAVTLVALSTPASSIAAQPASGPVIQSVTLDPDTGVIRIAGTGLGPELVVVVDGQPVTVLPGASGSLIEVWAPSTVVTTPGTFRLTVVDPVRQVGDAFVVASQAGRVAGAGASLGPMSTSGSPTAAEAPTALSGTSALSRGAGTASPPASAPSPNVVIEDTSAPFRTAIGGFALLFNTSGTHNTAAGYQALLNNASGSFNTATGSNALALNNNGYYTPPQATVRSTPISWATGIRPTATGR